MGRLTTVQLGLLLSVAILIGCGQFLLKFGAKGSEQITNLLLLAKLMLSPAVVAGLFVYAIGSVIWVYVLQEVPLSRAYPFLALAFVIVPAIGFFAFDETITLRYAIGVAFILVGLYLSSMNG